MSDLVIRGARENNLKNVNLTLPFNKLICFTGVSGSGKSSLAFDTLYAEGQRRYIEGLSSYARHFLGQLPRPKVDHISGLNPTISISQKTGSLSQRSTVGTITEISDYLRVLYARVGVRFCPHCNCEVTPQTRTEIINKIKAFPSDALISLWAPVVHDQKGRCYDVVTMLSKKGIRKLRIDGSVWSIDDDFLLDRQARHTIEALIDQFKISDCDERQIANSVDAALKMGQGGLVARWEPASEIPCSNDEAFASGGESFHKDLFGFVSSEEVEVGVSDTRRSEAFAVEQIAPPLPSSLATTPETEKGERYFNVDFVCPNCGTSFKELTPQMFSFNHSHGMCKHCQGMGIVYTFDPALLIPDPSKSLQQGCITPLGKWNEWGRWKQHIYHGVAAAIEKKYGLESGVVLETAWEELSEGVKHDLLWGLGGEDVVYSWDSSAQANKPGNSAGEYRWSGSFEGIIPKMLKQYNETTDKIQLKAMQRYMNEVPCAYCHGMRLNSEARAVFMETTADSFASKPYLSLPELYNISVKKVIEFLSALKLTETGALIAHELVAEIIKRLGFLVEVGLEYLTLGRTAPTLSGGELQRIRLAGQIGGGLVGVLYVLDEPSIGLHSRDNVRLINMLKKLRDLGNTVVVVEHDEDMMLAADYIVDFGPGPGAHGGEVVACGFVDELQTAKFKKSLTAKYLTGESSIEISRKSGATFEHFLTIKGIRHHNLKNIDVKIPLGCVVCVTGVSGSGKSSLVNEVVKDGLSAKLNDSKAKFDKFSSIDGLEYVKRLISIDQSPIGRSPRSNPATYIKLFDEIRKLYAETPEAKAKGYNPGRFSFNLSGGRCEACEGNGAKKIEMDFLADVWTTCPACGGRRFNQETLAIKYKGLSIDEVLELDVETALKHFDNVPKIRGMLQTLCNVGLGYMKLGQPSSTLSGGEAQRIKLAKELVKKSSGKTLYLLDEPTTGLHFADVQMLINVIRDLADAGNSILIVEHNLDVIKIADWIIDLGPEGGEGGGNIVCEGSPSAVAENEISWTGRALKSFLYEDKKKRLEELHAEVHKEERFARCYDEPLSIVRASEHNLKAVSTDIPRNKLTVCCGPSGSGKSSFAIDVVYSEGRRRYVESLSSYARQFLGQLQKPKVEHTSGISPSISIEQKTTSHSPRSTVGTITEILDYLRVIYARLGQRFCPDCNLPIESLSTEDIVSNIFATIDKKCSKFLILAPLQRERTQSDYKKLLEQLRVDGFSRLRIDNIIYSIDEAAELEFTSVRKMEVVIDRLRIDFPKETLEKSRSRVYGSVEMALNVGKGTVVVLTCDEHGQAPNWEEHAMRQGLWCETCGRTFELLTPKHFSFNSPLGWCPHCEGLGVQRGTNPNSFIKDPKRSIEQGVIPMFSDIDNPLVRACIRAFAREMEVPVDIPFERLDARIKRLIFNGTGDHWFEVKEADFARSKKTGSQRTGKRQSINSSEMKSVFKFQYKGIFPAVEEVGRLSSLFRGKLEFHLEECECSVCLGSRLRDDVSAVKFHNMNLDQVCRMPLGELAAFLKKLRLSAVEKKVAGELLKEIMTRVQFLIDVGLEYLTLSRPAPSLSGGEAQRIRLASQIGSGLEGILYVLDEPTIGLHSRDSHLLISAMKKLRDLGNTLLVVEHDRDVIKEADNIVDFGPGAGACGGHIVAEGTVRQIIENNSSVTGPYLSGKKYIPIPLNRRIKTKQHPELSSK